LVIRAVRVELFAARVLYRVSYRVVEYRLIPDADILWLPREERSPPALLAGSTTDRIARNTRPPVTTLL